MALDPSKNTLEQQKFVECDDGSVAVRTSLCGGTAAFTPSGLTTAGRVTEVQLNSSSWVALPPSPLLNRNAICIQNASGIEIKINYDNAVATYTGIIVPAGGQRYYDITDSIVIYAKSLSGTPTVTIEEIS